MTTKSPYWHLGQPYNIPTNNDRREDAYITIEGETYGAIIKGDQDIDNDGYIMKIEHSYYRLDRFTIDGKHSKNNYADKCLYVQQSRDNDDKAKTIKFNDHKFRYATEYGPVSVRL